MGVFKDFMFLIADIEPEFVEEVGGIEALGEAIDNLGDVTVVGVSLYSDILGLSDRHLTEDHDDFPLPHDSTGHRFTADGNYQITGFQAELNPEGAMFLLFNVCGCKITLKHLDTSSLEIDRILCPQNKNYVIESYGMCYVRYDIDLGKWHVVSL